VVPCTAGVIGALANAGHQAAYLFGVAVVGMGGNSIACHRQATGSVLAGGLIAPSHSWHL
jgi:hypothetical protein